MAQIYVPVMSPFSVTGPLHDADDRHIQSHHVAYEIAALSRSLDALVVEYDAQVAVVTEIQQRYNNSSNPSKNKDLATKLKAAEKKLFASILPYEIKSIRARLKDLNSDMLILTSR